MAAKENKLEIKQGVVDVEKQKTVFLRVSGFRGMYKGILFDDKGRSTTPVTNEVLNSLESQYPNCDVEIFDDFPK
jgi:hypothetical protein